MNTRFSPALVAGFAAAVLSTIPFMSFMSCCLIIPGASILALSFHFKIVGLYRIKTKEAIIIGLTTGMFAALFMTAFDFLITYLTKTNNFSQSFTEAEKMFRSLLLDNKSMTPAEFDMAMSPLRKMVYDINTTGLSAFYTATIFLQNLFGNSLFGSLGGIIGASLFKKKINNINNQ